MDYFQYIPNEILLSILNELSDVEQFELAQTSRFMVNWMRNWRRDSIRKDREKTITDLIKKPFSNITNIKRVHHALMNNNLDLFKYYESIGIVPKILYKVGGNLDIINYLISSLDGEKPKYDLSMWCLVYSIRFNDRAVFDKLFSLFPNINNYYANGVFTFHDAYHVSNIYQKLPIYALNYIGQNVKIMKNIPSCFKFCKQLCKYGNVDTIKLFSERIPRLRIIQDYMHIVEFNRIDILENCCKVDGLLNIGDMFIRNVGYSSSILMFNYLRDNRISLEIDSELVLYILNRNNNITKLQFLLDSGFKLDTLTRNAQSAILIARKLDFIHMLRENGCQFDQDYIEFAKNDPELYEIIR